MADSILDLNVLRATALRLFLATIWLQAGFVLIACLFLGVSPWYPTALALGIAATAQAVAHWDPAGSRSRIVAGVALMALISLLVAVFNGHNTQVDLHMYYFAALALLVASCDWRVIIAGTASVALHHVSLNFLLPFLIYPNGGDFFRLVLHAAILILEAAVLVWLALTLEKMFSAIKAEAAISERSRISVEASHQAALAAAEKAETLHRLHERDRTQVAEEDFATLNSLAEALERLASGDLTYRITAALPSKAESIRKDFNSALMKLQSAMVAVYESAGGIRGKTNEISAAAEDLSHRTEKQAVGLKESATALNEITQSVHSTAEGVIHARQAVAEAKNIAERSSQVVHQAVKSMSGIEQSSVKINQIIGVINEIAFQTNLLALNAGVEAARAGEAGRGFAVVAAEVRALAQRSGEAAKEIKDLISSSAHEVTAGANFVHQAGEAVEEMARQVIELDSVVTHIATSSQEQALNLNQVNAAINQMDQVTQQNNVMVEETSSASFSLMEQTEKLTQLLSSFKVDASETSDGSLQAERLQRCAAA